MSTQQQHTPHELHPLQTPLQQQQQQQQRGGTTVGFIFGLVIGLGAALAVAVYITKVPVPFLNKGASRSTAQDAAEAQKNKSWDPNSPLYGKTPARPPTPVVSGTVGAEPPAPDDPGAAPPSAPAASAPVAAPPASTTAKAAPAPGVRPSTDPLGDLARAKEKAHERATAAAADTAAVDPFNYFVQAGAFRTQADADAQRAKLAMMGWEARVSEREQNGRTVYRVRVGPFGKRDDAQQIKEKLDSAAVDSALVRVQR